MTTISERRQHLDFDATWRVVKWDLSPEFSGSMSAALNGLPGDGVKAADVVGSINGKRPTLIVVEFKDYSYPQAVATGQSQSRVALRDVIRKVMDSITGATFAHNANGARCGELKDWQTVLANRPAMLVLLCVETTPTQAPIVVNAWRTELQRRLNWLGPNAQIVVTCGARAFRKLGVTYRAQ